MANLTIKDIARISGCSVSTISRVINDRPDVRPETKEHVLKVMREAGFVPNTNARQLKIQQSRSLVFVVKGTRNLFFSVFRRLINNKRISPQYTRIRCDCLGRSHTDLRCIYAACCPDTLAFFCIWHCSVPHRIVRKLDGQMRNLGFICSRLLLRVNHHKFFRCIMACTGIVVSRDHGGTVIRCFLSN